MTMLYPCPLCEPHIHFSSRELLIDHLVNVHGMSRKEAERKVELMERRWPFLIRDIKKLFETRGLEGWL